MNQALPDSAADRLKKQEKPLKAVLIPCITCALFIIFMSAENLLWRMTSYYPAAFARAKYVSDVTLLTPAAVRKICNTPLSLPELRIKSGVLYLRCGTQGVEGVWRIETHY